jgi:hypothetical protein
MPIRLLLEHDHSCWARRHCKVVSRVRGGLGQTRINGSHRPLSAEVAKVIIEVAKQGERDPERLCALAVQQLSK